ncbi:hypothetical protein C4585_02180 [Candidatus Parcubacteria bacterium]|nr:MAG: hypothetical protein C4585_02180 [Candidatus Parcubacteria bacterium]
MSVRLFSGPPYVVACQETPLGSPTTSPDQSPQTRKKRNTEAPPTKVELTSLRTLADEYALPVLMVPPGPSVPPFSPFVASSGPVSVVLFGSPSSPISPPDEAAMLPPVLASAVAVPMKSASLFGVTSNVLELMLKKGW